MRANVNKNQLKLNMLLDIKENLPQGKLSMASALAYINGLIAIYRKAHNDLSSDEHKKLDKKMIEVIFAKYLEQNYGGDQGFNEELAEYLKMLPPEVAQLISDGALRSRKLSKKDLELLISNLSYKVLEAAVKHNFIANEQAKPDDKELNESLEKYKDAKRTLKRGRLYRVVQKKGMESDAIAIRQYADKLAKDIAAKEISYCGQLSEKVISFYTANELEVQRNEMREDDLIQIGGDDEYLHLGNDEVERGL